MPDDLNRFSAVVLVLFAVSIFFVINPVSIPLRLPWRRGQHDSKDGKQRREYRIHIGTLTAPLIVVLVLWASTCINSGVIRDGIVGVEGIKPYNILILFFSLAYMAITLDISGVLQAAAFWVSNKGGSSGWRLYLYFYLMLTAFSIIVGNDPVILSGTVFLVYWTQATKVDSMAWLYAEFAAANTASMVLFVGNPTNVVICEGFEIRNIAYTAYTIFPFLACSLVCYGALAIQFRGERYIPRRMPDIATLDPRSVLRDPVGAIVGSLIFGSCLAVLLGVSFTSIDVWEITLPFAAAKFVWDLAWDYYQFVRRGGAGKQPRSTTDPVDLMKIQMQHMQRTNTHDVRSTDPERGISSIQFTEKPAGAAQHPHVKEKQFSDASTTLELEETRAEAVAPLDRRISHENPATPGALVDEPEPMASSQISGATLVDKPSRWTWFRERWPTITTAIPRLPFGLVPFAFLQFILVEALAFRGWISVFARWLEIASGGKPYPVLLLVGILGIVLCNISGTNIGATILLTKVIRAARLSRSATLAGAIALAVASNIGAVSFVFSASLAGLLWRAILKQKDIKMKQTTFAKWNSLPLLVMTIAGLGAACAELAVIMHYGLAGTNDNHIE